MKWQNKLTKKELKHLREHGITTLTQAKANAAAQKKLRDSNALGGEPCWDCRFANKKLGLEV